MVDFRILGPLEVRAGAGPLPLGGAKPRVLLATLLLHANQPVSTDTLVDALWPHRAPRSAVGNLRTYVSTLRTRLGDGPDRIRASGSGYRIDVDVTELDMLAFGELTAAARRQREAGRSEDALASLADAAALWRGQPLADLPAVPGWDVLIGRLVERRLAAAEEHVVLRLAHGQHAEAITELRELVAELPFREELWGRLLLALHATGRRAEALLAYTEVRTRLAEELGVEPGPELREIHRALLADDRTDLGAGTGTGAARHNPVCQLPLDPPDFTGRADALDAVAQVLSRRDRPGVAVITGAPGTGKTTLAVHAAHAARRDFPDGQLYVNLGATRAAADALGELLRALGAAVPDDSAPDGVDERAARFRSLVADRRMLIVLDDASSASQVLPLLPATPGCAALVTSRRRIAELPGARQVELDELDSAEAVELLGRITGGDRVRAEPDEAERIVRACGRLPLALRNVGAKLAARPSWPLRVLADRLADESTRLEELGIRTSVEATYRLLPEPAARAFRLLGLLALPSYPGWVIDALLGRPAPDALDALVDANLVRSQGTDRAGQPRYRLPEPLRLHAREAVSAEPERERSAAVARALSGWLALVRRACAKLPVSVFAPVDNDPLPWQPDQAVFRLVGADPLAWLAAERGTVLAAVDLAGRDGHPELARRLATGLVPWFDLRGRDDDWRRTHRRALAAIRGAARRNSLDARPGTAALLRGLGQLALYRDAYREATTCFRRARDLFVSVGDSRGVAGALAGLAAVDRVCGRHGDAAERGLLVLRMFGEISDRHGVAYAHNALGAVHLSAGSRAEAQAHCTEALRLSRRIGDRHREAHVLVNLGLLHEQAGRPADAMTVAERALAIFQRIGDTRGELYARHLLGRQLAALGRHRQAVTVLGRALARHRRHGDRRGEASTAQVLGELHRRLGRVEHARTHLSRAARLWEELGAAPERATATSTLADLEATG